ncbi:MAG TPA: GH25 family lysozyme [Caulobacter sp.]|nr:GH25 family lysozyme [Caulobacter sp.]
MDRRIVLAAAGAALLGLLALTLPLLAVRAFHEHEPDRSRYPLRGLDVSHHQGPIDWRAAAADDVAFAWIKASEGGDHRDSRFTQNWRAARAAGVRVGAYHFFTLCRPGAAQAANFLAATPRRTDGLPPAVDLEFGGNCGEHPDGPALRRELEAFLAPVEARDGPAVLYVTREFLEAYGRHLPDRPLWRRSILMRPRGAAKWTVWQYHHRGRVEGITGPVDLNVFVGDAAAFDAFLSQR